jgi:hypothetical protein
MRSVSARYLRSTARAAIPLAATILVACAVNSPPPPSGGGESSIYTNEKAGTAVTGSQSLDSTHSMPDSIYFMADYPDTSDTDFDRMFLEIHAGMTEELLKIEKSGKGGTRLAEIQSIVITAEEFYLEGNPLVAIRLLTEAELLLRQLP